MSSFSTKILSGIQYVIVVALVASGLALLAFGPRAGEKLPRNCVIVDYWEKWTGIEEAGMRQIVDDFNSTVGREKHIYVRYLSTSSIEQKTLVSIAAGMPPDVAGLYNQDIPQFAAMDSLEPLGRLGRAARHHRRIYKKVFWDECHYDGHLYGLVSSAYDVALYYNKTPFSRRAPQLCESRGLDPHRAPRTIAELDEYAQALDRIDSVGPDHARRLSSHRAGLVSSITPASGSEEAGGTPPGHRFTFTNPGVVNAYKWIQSYYKRLGPGAVAEFQSGFGNFDSPQNPFLVPTVAMVQQGTFFAHFIHHLRPSMDGHWAAAPFPSALPNLPRCDLLQLRRAGDPARSQTSQRRRSSSSLSSIARTRWRSWPTSTAKSPRWPR